MHRAVRIEFETKYTGKANYSLLVKIYDPVLR